MNALESSAPNESRRALALHMRAIALMVNAKHREASAAFADAEKAWLAIGDEGRALAARVGRTEDLIRVGAYQQAIDLARSFQGGRSAESYFSVRLEQSRCLALLYMADLAEAESCYRWDLEQFEKLDERAELANTLQAYAGLQVSQGRYEKGEEVVRRALTIVEGPLAPLFRGRLYLMLADIALRRGMLSTSLDASDRALVEFEKVEADRAEVPRWVANTYLNVSSLYGVLGAYDEAYRSAADAIERLAPRQAPSRVASAARVVSDLDRDTGRFELALLLARMSENLYAALQMRAAADDARVARLEILLADGDFAALDNELSAKTIDLLHPSPRLQLIVASADIRHGRLDHARSIIDELQREAIPLHEALMLVEIEAAYWDANGKPERSDEVLADAAKRIRSLAAQTSNRLLRYVIERQVLPLQQIAFDRLLREASTDAAISRRVASRAWSWLTVGTDIRSTGKPSRSRTVETEAFDRAVAEELLLTTSSAKPKPAADSRRHLLSLLVSGGGNAPSDGGARVDPSQALACIQEQLEEGAAFVAYLGGRKRSGLLWVTREQAFVTEAAAGRDEIQRSATVLHALLGSPASAVSDLAPMAEELSRLLLSRQPGVPHPSRVYVLDQDSDGIAWNVLLWGGAAEAFVDLLPVSRVVLTRSVDAGPPSVPAQIRVAVAAQRSAASLLPELSMAPEEAGQIRAAAATRPVAVIQQEIVDRSEVMKLLAKENSWLHVAAHGIARPSRLGYSGIWLESTGSDRAPEFLSWIDVIDADVRADLVVLNACQLDERAGPWGASTFASALSRAGARQVVAAQWPVSDSAAGIWVPAFYGALLEDPAHSAADALFLAQQRLRATRQFQHPFYWAGLEVVSHFRG